MPAEWGTYEDSGFFCSLFPLEEAIRTVMHHSRTANVRLNVRELLAPILFCGEAPITVRSVSRMAKEVADAKSELTLLAEKLLLLQEELSLGNRGGVA